ncbi:hypothetical protein VTO73DRAFT_15257 [Trametes versicolor]
MAMHTNIEHAIATVKERGHELTVPNVLAAYINCIAPHIAPEDAADENSLAQAAIVSFERAMDKYPAPSPLLPAAASTRALAKARPAAPAEVAQDAVGKRMFCTEIAKLRDEYLRALLRVSEYDTGAQGCTCLSCGCLLKVRSDQVRKLDSGDEDGVDFVQPVRKRRTRKANIKKGRAVKKAPFDPYAPSTSRVAI